MQSDPPSSTLFLILSGSQSSIASQLPRRPTPTPPTPCSAGFICCCVGCNLPSHRNCLVVPLQRHQHPSSVVLIGQPSIVATAPAIAPSLELEAAICDSATTCTLRWQVANTKQQQKRLELRTLQLHSNKMTLHASARRVHPRSKTATARVGIKRTSARTPLQHPKRKEKEDNNDTN